MRDAGIDELEVAESAKIDGSGLQEWSIGAKHQMGPLEDWVPIGMELHVRDIQEYHEPYNFVNSTTSLRSLCSYEISVTNNIPVLTCTT